MSDKEVFYVAGVGQSSVWGPTMGLRLVNKWGRIYPVLQQLWRERETGAEDWRDVPYLGSEDAPAVLTEK